MQSWESISPLYWPQINIEYRKALCAYLLKPFRNSFHLISHFGITHTPHGPTHINWTTLRGGKYHNPIQFLLLFMSICVRGLGMVLVLEWFPHYANGCSLSALNIAHTPRVPNQKFIRPICICLIQYFIFIQSSYVVCLTHSTSYAMRKIFAKIRNVNENCISLARENCSNNFYDKELNTECNICGCLRFIYILKLRNIICVAYESNLPITFAKRIIHH